MVHGKSLDSESYITTHKRSHLTLFFFFKSSVQDFYQRMFGELILQHHWNINRIPFYRVLNNIIDSFLKCLTRDQKVHFFSSILFCRKYINNDTKTTIEAIEMEADTAATILCRLFLWYPLSATFSFFLVESLQHPIDTQDGALGVCGADETSDCSLCSKKVISWWNLIDLKGRYLLKLIRTHSVVFWCTRLT